MIRNNATVSTTRLTGRDVSNGGSSISARKPFCQPVACASAYPAARRHTTATPARQPLLGSCGTCIA